MATSKRILTLGKPRMSFQPPRHPQAPFNPFSISFSAIVRKVSRSRRTSPVHLIRASTPLWPSLCAFLQSPVIPITLILAADILSLSPHYKNTPLISLVTSRHSTPLTFRPPTPGYLFRLATMSPDSRLSPQALFLPLLYWLIAFSSPQAITSANTSCGTPASTSLLKYGEPRWHGNIASERRYRGSTNDDIKHCHCVSFGGSNRCIYSSILHRIYVGNSSVWRLPRMLVSPLCLRR